MFVDGCLKFICGAIILSVKDPIHIYHHFFRPILLRCGLFDQIKMDPRTKNSACVCLFRNFLRNTGLTKGELLGVRPPGGDSGFQVTRRCEWGHKLKAKKIPLGLKRTPRNPLDQNDDCTRERVSVGTVHGGKK